jgi:hypothetical protein
MRARDAIEEISLHSGRVLLRTRPLLSCRFDPDYPRALYDFAVQYGYRGYCQLLEIEKWLNRYDIRVPSHLRDYGPRLSPFALAAQLGIRFRLGVDEEQAATMLYGLDNRRFRFTLKSDWIIATVQAFAARRAAVAARAYEVRRAPAPRKIEVDHKHSGKVTLELSGTLAPRPAPPAPAPDEQPGSAAEQMKPEKLEAKDRATPDRGPGDLKGLANDAEAGLQTGPKRPRRTVALTPEWGAKIDAYLAEDPARGEGKVTKYLDGLGKDRFRRGDIRNRIAAWKKQNQETARAEK